MRDHPMIQSIEKTGYPENMVNQPECEGVDYFGNEILPGDEVVEYDGEMVLKENLDKFLAEMGFTFKIVG